MQASRFGFRPITRIALVAPVLLAMVACFLMQPQPAALAAPLLGPWAGLAFGHMDCTLAAQFPIGSFALLGSGVLAFFGRLRASNDTVRTVLDVLLLLWLTIWCAFAVLSVLNTTS